LCVGCDVSRASDKMGPHMIDLRSVSALLDDLEVSYRIDGETAILKLDR